MLLSEAIETDTYNVTVTMTKKEYEAWLTIKEQAARVRGDYGFALIRFSHGQVLIHSISTHPERAR